MAAIRVYNEIPAGEEARWAQAIDLNDYPTRCVRAASGVALGSSYANMTPVIAKPVKQEYKYAAITI